METSKRISETPREKRNFVIFWALCFVAVVLVCIFSPNVFTTN